MTRRPSSYAGTRRMRADNPIPMTAAQYLRWLNKQRPLSPPANDNVTWADTVEAAREGVAGDEVDDGYLAAIRLEPRQVGTAAGQVPLEVARRLVGAGLVRKRPG